MKKAAAAARMFLFHFIQQAITSQKASLVMRPKT